jgi:two-component system chemotaxis response regulator CheY
MQQLNLEDLSILLVEPSLAQAKIITRALQSAGIHHVEHAPGPQQAMDRMNTFHPDLVASAMYFDGSTGTELLLALRADSRFEATPFMLVSSEQKFEYLDPIKQAGVVAILPKPFGAEELKVALLSTLNYLENSEVELSNFDIATVRFLVVDDSTLARKHICRVLANMGAEQITEAIDGSVAMTLMQEHEFDMVITDYNMPKVDGEQLLRYIREQSSQSYLPVVMVTSEQNNAVLSSIQRSGVSAMCDKPFDAEHVRHLLQRLL